MSVLNGIEAHVSGSGILGVAIFMVLLVLGFVLHRLNMKKTYQKVVATSELEMSEDDLLEEMFTRQGSNFNAAAVSAWMLLFVAFAYFYFLTPGFFQYNYFRVPDLASSRLGFMIFGLLVLLLAGVVAAFFPRQVYGYYHISRKIKAAIMFTVPLLIASVILSAYQGTIHPDQNPGLRFVSFLALFVSQAMLLWPVYDYALEEMR